MRNKSEAQLKQEKDRDIKGALDILAPFLQSFSWNKWGDLSVPWNTGRRLSRKKAKHEK